MNFLQYIGALIVVVMFVAGAVGMISRAAAKSQYAALRENYVLLKERYDDREGDMTKLRGEVGELTTKANVLQDTVNSSHEIASLTAMVSGLKRQEQSNHNETISVLRGIEEYMRIRRGDV